MLRPQANIVGVIPHLRYSNSSLTPTLTRSVHPTPDERLPRRSDSVIFKEMDEGAVLFCTRTEVYFGLNPVGVQIWALLETESGTLLEVVDALAATYPDHPRQELETDAREFLDALLENELVVPSSSASP